MKIVFYDTTETKPTSLSPVPLTWLWRLGVKFTGADKVFGVSSWEEVYDHLEALDQVDEIQVWGHGRPGSPLINGHHPDLVLLATVLSGKTTEATTIWWRSCDVHRGSLGHAFARRCSLLLNVVSVGHCAVISWPNPLIQKAICALRPEEMPWWPEDGSGLPNVWTTTMKVPMKAYKPVLA